MSGTIYCFNTISIPNVIKCGHTQQALETRLRGYLGPSKPKTLIFHRRVADSVQAEQMMLALMRQCRSVTPRLDLGNEWFELENAQDFSPLTLIADIVQRAAMHPPKMPQPYCNPHPTSEYTATQPQMMKSLQKYFRNMDDFVEHGAAEDAFQSAKALMNAFDESRWCPVFAEFLPFGKTNREMLIKKRYEERITSC